jgi:hypothetical protein
MFSKLLEHAPRFRFQVRTKGMHFSSVWMLCFCFVVDHKATMSGFESLSHKL